MAKITPFRGIVYNQAAAGDINTLVCPPYDIISPADQQELYGKSPYNVIQLEYGREAAGDSAGKDRYTRAAALFQGWQQQGILQRNDRPAIYVYEMQYPHGDAVRKLRGFICQIRIEDFDSGVVLPHENTLSGPKADRLNLLRACQANFSQIFSLFSDPSGTISDVLSKISGLPEMEAAGENNVLHPAVIETITRAMADKPFFIADGHHRYETALNYRNERRAAAGTFTGDEPYNFVTMYLARLEDPGLTILPAHRALFSLPGFSADSFEEGLHKYFDMERLDFDAASEATARRTMLDTMAARAARSRIFGMRMQGRNSYYLLTLRSEEDMDRLLSGKSSAYRRLDVSILHHLIIDKLLGVGIDTHKLGKNIEYIKDADEAVKRLDDGKAKIIVFMNPTKVGEVKAVAGAGERMPQKATYFYPKLLTGLVMHRLD